MTIPLSERAPSRPLLWLEIPLALLLWSSAFPAIRVALREYSPAHIALGRYLVASLTLGIMMGFERPPLPARGDWGRIFFAGFWGFSLYNIALNTGEMHVPAGAASFLVNTAPVWTLIVLTLTGRERVPLRGWLGVAISLCGVAIIALARGEQIEPDPEFLKGAAWILLAAFGTSFYVITQKGLLARYKPLPLTAFMIWGGTLLLLPFGGGLLQQVQKASPGATWAVVYMGIFPGAIGYALWTRVLTQLDVSRAMSFIYLIPIGATGISWVWLGEKLALLALLGGLLVLTGVVTVNAARTNKPHSANDTLEPQAPIE